LDFLLICSDNEGLPLSAIEAGYMSKVVISTDVGSVSEVVTNEVTGFITEKNSDEIIAVLEQLLENHAKQKEFGAAARIKIENQFSLSNSLEKISRLYLDLIYLQT
jgi:glycosyltransferase involved in cell wall biosynthesis